MAVDPITDAQSDMTEQIRWGLSRAEMALAKLLGAVPALIQRVRNAEAAVAAHEARIAALEARVTKLGG